MTIPANRRTGNQIIMSQIFDFLRRDEMERSKLPPIRSPEIDMPIEEPIDPQLLTEQAEFEHRQIVQEPELTQRDSIGCNAFDLANSTNQLRNVLDPLTIVGEQFRVLRTRLNLMQKQNGIKTVLITSSVSREGKSFAASGLAGVFAQEQGKQVVVIDADMRKPGSGRDFGFNGDSGNIGLAQVLQGKRKFRSALMASTNSQLWFLPSGAQPANPSELLSSPVLESVLRSAAEIFDWVIVDSPPALTLSDAALIAPLFDAVVLVVKANSTPAKLVIETINRVGQNRICGVVLNGQKQFHSSRYYYQYYYQNSKKKK
jgi:protein-tyrosine kinase